jgi:single-strand DNA-binding protein
MTQTATPRPAGPRHRNEIVLVGELTTAPTERTTAAGEEIVTFRLDVERDHESGFGTDSIECTVQIPRLRRSATAWQPGDTLEVLGAVRRRFYRVGNASRPFVVVDVARARRLAGAPVKRRRTRE